MGNVGVIWAAAPSLNKLEAELSRVLANVAADQVISVSHASAPVRERQSGGLWSNRIADTRLEYSALVLVRT